MKYVVDPVAVRRNPRLCTQVDGVTVSLTGKELRFKRPANEVIPDPDEQVALPATQEQLATLHKQGNPLIKVVQEPASAATAQPAHK